MKYSGSIALVYIVKNLVSGFTGHEGRVTGGVYEVILARLYYRVKATHQPTHPLQYTEELQSRELEKSWTNTNVITDRRGVDVIASLLKGCQSCK